MRFIKAAILLLLSASCDILAQDVIVYTEPSPPYQYTQDGVVVGQATEHVERILATAGLSYRIEMYPWARAYRNALETPNALIYAIAKTPARAPLFHWIAPVVDYELALVSLSDRRDLTADALASLHRYRFATQRDDIAQQWLEQQGLNEDKHFLSCADIQCSWQLLLNRNVDMIIDDPALIKPVLDALGTHETAKIVAPIPALKITGYLAANQHMPPGNIKRLQQAIQQLALNAESQH
ncbi:transporter substrate-binding domain-containing protein [Aestuariibacter halophilus]|uniref:Transporter substrate-binding domain-containing protein n=1 Tax=Fluctibacter halophilus TaxID=226011 RepID=A0ABS8GB18_9ALTE|nr:transporter substrate-binding domain-containing protein [Aestuariibacter halophilus]MCC2616914.1 transporter substrate-binding domain-containing protein [Aestuariibacter halophilus]